MTPLYQPVCVRCEEQGIESLATMKRWDEDLCADCDQTLNEQAYERSLSDFYGGSGPVSIAEQMDAAYTLDKRLR